MYIVTRYNLNPAGLRAKVRSMTACSVLAALACSAMLAGGAELHGGWSASSKGRNFAGSWTAEAHQSGGVTGSWTLADASGKVLMRGDWSASKAAQSWNGAWRAGGYTGTWTAAVSLSPEAALVKMLESALQAEVGGSWKTGAFSGAWSIRASP